MKRWLSLLLALFLTLSPVAYAQEEDGGLWYEDQAIALVQELDVLIHDESYGSLYGIPSIAGDLVDEVRKTDFSAMPQSALRFTLPNIDGLLSFVLSPSTSSDGSELSEVATKRILDNLPSMLISILNGSADEELVILSSVYNTSKTFVLPDGFQNAIVLLRYPGDYWAAVSFTQTGDNTGTASACFVKANVQEAIDQLTDNLGGKIMYALLFKETVYD